MNETRRLRPWLVASAAYAVLAVLVTWPIAAQLSSAFPHDAFDPALNAWILWWNAHAVPFTARWWSPPNFWPVTGALTFSEHLFGISVLTTPLQWLGAGPVTTYNIALLASYPLTAIAAHALVFAIVRRHGPAALAALILGFSPYRVAQVPHLQMLWAFGIPLALLAAHRYLEDGRRSWLIAFGAAWLMQALSNSYYMVFFPVLFAGWILWFGVGAPRRTAAILATAIVSSLPLLPIVWSYARIHHELNLTRWFTEIESFGADLTAIFATAPEMVLWRHFSIEGRGEGQLFPGAIALGLVIAGTVAAARSRLARRSRARHYADAARLALTGLALVVALAALSSRLMGPWHISLAGYPLVSVSSPEKPMTVVMVLLVAAFIASSTFADVWRERSIFAFYTLAAAAMFALSWGPHPRLNGTPILFRGPYSLLLHLPGFSEVRVPARFGMLVVLCLAVSAALAFARMTESLAPRVRRLATIVCAAAVIVESWSSIAIASSAAAIPALQRSDLTGPVVQLPLGASWLDAPAQFRLITHGRPVVNGYSGYAPPHYRLLALALNLNDGDVLKGLTTTTPLVAVLDRREEIERWRRIVLGQHGRLVAEDGGFEIYQLPLDPRQPARTDAALPIASVDASAGADRVGRMLDGDLETEWNSQRAQSGGEYIVVDLGSNRHVTTLRLTAGPFIGDYPRQLAVDCAADGADWQPCWHGSIAGLLLRSVLDYAPTAAAAIPIDREGVRRLRITQTGSDPVNGWSIAELAVLGR
jgi:hypothetical protein